MRTFEERKNEIFRRSEERIAKRRKTAYRVILSCVPVVLCVTALSGYMMLGGFFRLDSAVPESAVDMELNYGLADSAQESSESAPELQSLQISDGAVTRTSTDAAVLQLFWAVAAGPLDYADDNVVPESVDESDVKYGTGCVTGSQIIEGDPYPVAFTYMDGTTVWFTLRGNRLTREDGETYMLTDEQAAALYALLEDTP